MPMTRLEEPPADRRKPTITISAPDPMLRMAMPSSHALVALMTAPNPVRSLAAPAIPSFACDCADV